MICELRNVNKRFSQGDTEVTALYDVSLQIAEGEFVALMGPSGSGKSTLLNLAGGLDTPTDGSVSVGGVDLTMLDPPALAEMRRRRVGYVFQTLNLVSSLTMVENVMLPLELDGMRAKAARVAALDALGEAGVSELAERFPDDCSGGQQQRVAIARSIVGDRRLLLADEPTGALDTTTGEKILELLARQCDRGCAVLLVTHEPRFASWADRVVFLRDGEIVATSTATPSRDDRSHNGNDNDNDLTQGTLTPSESF